jgi:hypothetical protein
MIWEHTFPRHPVYMHDGAYGECQSEVSDGKNETLCCGNERLETIVGDQTHLGSFLGSESHNQSITICQDIAVGKKLTVDAREDKMWGFKWYTLGGEKRLMGSTGEWRKASVETTTRGQSDRLPESCGILCRQETATASR